MNAAVLVLAVGALALVLAISGTAKLLNRTRSHEALRALRMPGPLGTRGFAVGWAILEVAVGVGLLALPGRWALAAGVGAAAMMTGHLAVVVRASRFPEPVHCHCFGALDRDPVGPHTIVRNGGFLALAVVALGGMSWPAPVGTSMIGLARSLTGQDPGLLQLGLLVVGAGAVVLLGRSVGRTSATDLSTSPDGRTGTDQPGGVDGRVAVAGLRGTLTEHRLPDIFGASPDVRSFTGEQRSVLIFLSTSCAACGALAEQLPSWRSELSDLGVQLRVVTAQPAASALSSFPLLGSFLHQDVDGSLAGELGITTFPAAATVGRDGPGSVDDGPALGAHAVTALVDNIRAVEGVRA